MQMGNSLFLSKSNTGQAASSQSFRSGIHIQDNRPHTSLQRKSLSGSDKVTQLAWIEVTNEPHATQMWAPEEDGVTWYSDGAEVWFRVTSPHSIRKGTAVDYTALAGHANRRPWQAWNEISVEPSMEWVKAVNRVPKSTDPDHGAMLAAFRQKYGAGIKLWSGLQKALATRHQKADANTAAEYANRYNSPVTAGADLSITAKQASNQVGGYFGVASTTKGQDHSAYANYFHPATGTIIADSNYANKDIDSAHTGGVARINNSEILYHQYKATGGNLANLNQVIRSNIANKDTQYILTLSQHNLSDKMNERTWTPANKEFYALLGTDNVKGVTFLLGQHANETGGKTITSIVTKGIAYIKINIG
jgi:hypothetical protein